MRRFAAGIAPLWVALGATLGGLALAFALKVPCTTHSWDGYQYRRLCYNDIQPLFGARGIDRGVTPYGQESVGTDRQIEYPVLTGTFMDITGRLLRFLQRAGIAPNTNESYFVLSTILLAPFALLVSLKMRLRVRAGRLMLWALGPPLILYSFHNWDLLAVAGAVWGLVEVERRSWISGGIGLGLGASAKLYPLFLAPGAFLSGPGKRERSRFAFGLLVALTAANLPRIILSWQGWFAVWTFHGRRYPDFGTIWFWIAHHGRRLAPSSWWDSDGYRDLVTMGGLLMFGAATVFFIVRGWNRRKEPDGYPVAATGLGILAAFLLVSKVHSPQYALWVVPFLVLLNVPLWLVAGYLVADIALFTSGFYWFTVLDAPAPAWRGVFEASTFVRAAALGGLAWWAGRAHRLLPRT